jgi:hypothetical protein
MRRTVVGSTPQRCAKSRCEHSPESSSSQICSFSSALNYRRERRGLPVASFASCLSVIKPPLTLTWAPPTLRDHRRENGHEVRRRRGAGPGVEDAFMAALRSIDRIYALERASGHNAHVTSPTEIQAFWDEHESLPGFSVGT